MHARESTRWIRLGLASGPVVAIGGIRQGRRARFQLLLFSQTKLLLACQQFKQQTDGFEHYLLVLTRTVRLRAEARMNDLSTG